MSGPTETGSAALALLRGMTGATGDRFANRWNTQLPPRERRWWLRLAFPEMPARDVDHMGARTWEKLDPAERDRIKSAVVRVAGRAQWLLSDHAADTSTILEN